jgi:hypothetical protein
MKDTSLRSILPLAPYLALSRELAELIVPVRPRADFRAQLYHSLVAQARQRPANAALLPLPELEPAAGIPTRFARWVITAPAQDRRWVWGAAAVGSAVSLAGLVTYVWRRRGSRAA